mgnify:CR=1 FL=1
MQKASTRKAKVPNPQKASRGSARNKRTSVGNAKARSQRSVKNAERRSTGHTETGSRANANIYTQPRSARMHPGKARRKQGVSR